jgi:hypothetical protein
MASEGGGNGDDPRELWLDRIKDQVKDQVKQKLSGEWKEERWTEFVKEVAWWLHSSRGEAGTHVAVGAATGLITYGVSNEEDLQHIADDKKEFRDELKAEGILPAICNSLFDEYVAPQLRHSLLRDGLPEMTMSGSRTDGSASKNHDPASCIVKPFGLLADRGWKNVVSSLYTTMENLHLTTLNYSSESDIQGHVKNLLSDVVGMAELSSITCLNELSIFGHRVDIWLIARGGKPVGVVEVKKPGSDILYNKHVLGQLYNYMLRLQSFFGVKHVFGIVTTYQEWRICWLRDANQSAANGTPLQNFSKPLDFQAQALLSNYNQQRRGHSSSSQRQDRTMFGTDVIPWDHQDIVRALCSVLVKMTESPSELVMLIDPERPYIVATEDQWTWETNVFPEDFTEDKLHHQGIPDLGEGLVFLDDFGAGADGRAWRACTLGSWHGCVVKFAAAEETLQTELQNWEVLNGKGKARLITVCSERALLLPYLRPVDFENKTEAHAVKSLIERVSQDGYTHNDLHRRHVGFPSPAPKRQRPGNASDEKTEMVPLMFDLVQLVATNDPSKAKREMLAKLNFSDSE